MLPRKPIKSDSLNGIVSETTVVLRGKHILPNVAEIDKSGVSVPYGDTKRWHRKHIPMHTHICLPAAS